MIQRRHKSPTYVAPAPISVRGLSGTGLVLSGGGACGAWEAGALKALAELGARFEAVSGASVGALNGAVASAARDAGEAASRLEVAWSRLGEVGLLRPNLETAWKALARLVAAGLEGPAASGWGLRRAVLDVLSLVSDGGLLSDGPLRGLLDRWCGDDELERGLPLHVSLYGDQARGAGAALGEFLLARYGDQDTRKPVFALVQDLPRPFRKEAILASAALPFLFGAGRVGGVAFRDGGLGGWRGREGNVPAGPLLEGGRLRLVVLCLEAGEPWTPPAGAGAPVLLLRPSAPLEAGLRRPAMLDFSSGTLSRWMEQGYRDVSSRAGEAAAFLEGRVGPPARRTAAGGRAGR